MSSDQPVTETPPPRRPKPAESFAILFMVALGWTCSSSHGGSGSSGDRDDPDKPTNFFGTPQSAEIVVERPAAGDE